MKKEITEYVAGSSLTRKQKKSLFAAIAIPLAVGGASGFLTRNSMSTFQKLKKPPLSPPGWLFPVVWTILFVCMGIASWKIWQQPESKERSRALKLYAAQLVVNFFWPILFFLAKQYTIAFAWLCLLWYLVYTCMIQFWMLSKKAGDLLVPYLVWLTYAGYLNLFISILN